MVSVHCDGNSEELRKILKSGILNLIGQHITQSITHPQQPPIHNRPSIGIHVLPHVSSPLFVPKNDGWINVIQAQPLCSLQG